jgi:hypothetical protein
MTGTPGDVADTISATLERHEHIPDGSPGSGAWSRQSEHAGVTRTSGTKAELGYSGFIWTHSDGLTWLRLDNG